jgi:hypothetical protein
MMKVLFLAGQCDEITHQLAKGRPNEPLEGMIDKRCAFADPLIEML